MLVSLNLLCHSARLFGKIHSSSAVDKMQAFYRGEQPGACTHYVRTLTRLRGEKTDAHVASFFRLHFIPSSTMPELCETLHYPPLLQSEGGFVLRRKTLQQRLQFHQALRSSGPAGGEADDGVRLVQLLPEPEGHALRQLLHLPIFHHHELLVGGGL